MNTTWVHVLASLSRGCRRGRGGIGVGDEGVERLLNLDDLSCYQGSRYGAERHGTLCQELGVDETVVPNM